MEPEIAPMSGKKKLLISILVIGIIVLIGVGVVSFIAKQENILHPKSQKSPTEVVSPPKVYTQEEKIQILTDIASSTKPTVPQEEAIRTLENLSKDTPQDTTSEEEKLRILQSLGSQTAQ